MLMISNFFIFSPFLHCKAPRAQDVSVIITVTDVSTTCVVFMFRVNMSCITSLDGITPVIDLIGQLRCDLIGRLSVNP